MIYLLSFLLSFCSISYQFIIARVLGQFSNDEVLSQSITLGFYLVAMGLGSQMTARLTAVKTFRRFLILETSLSLLGVVLVPCLYLGYILATVFFADSFEWLSQIGLFSINTEKVFIFQVFTVAVGFLTGAELPLLLKLQEIKSKAENFNRILAFNYFGALVGSFVVALFLLPRLDLIRSSVLIGIINFVSIFLLLALRVENFKKNLLAALTISVLFFGTCWGSLKYADEVQQAYMKSFYLEFQMREFSWTAVKNFWNAMGAFTDIERYVTPYQIIDIVPENMMLSKQMTGDFSLYLNMQAQFSHKTQDSYHESMADGALNLAHRPVKNILILGAGDGLLAAELLKNPDITQITLVELDPFMIYLANEYAEIKKLNNASLFDPRVKVVIDDAFHFIRKTREKYDAVFVDFPFPVSYELGKLFSVEFYSSLKKIIQPEGFAVLDIPIYRILEPEDISSRILPQDIIFSSLHAAGFDNIFLYGIYESFAFVSLDSKPIAFNYELLPKRLSPKTLVNLTGMSEFQKQIKISNKNVNSIFKPKRFEW